MRNLIANWKLQIANWKSLPSPFGRGAGGEGVGKSHLKGKHFSSHSPNPNPLQMGKGTLNPQFAKPQISRSRALLGNINKFCILLPLIIILACIGCRDRAKIQSSGNSQWQESGAKWQEELLTYAIDNLNQMEKFQTQETLFHIFRQIYGLKETIADKNKNETLDPLSAAWPETEMFTQVIERLNQWVRSQPPPGDWKPDPRIETLPESLKDLPLVKGLGSLEFTAFDGYALQESVYLRNAALWARGDALDDLTRAKNLFAWTIRNIQLETESKDRIPLFPWESLFFGRGTAMERAWVFILMARQEGLDAVVLALADPAENTPIARGIRPLQPWCVAVLIDKNAYLFDPLLGMPIPAKDGIRHDAKGRLELQPATLAEVAADESLLKRLDIDSEKTYPVKQADLQNLAALVETSPTALSYRMKLIESRLAGKQKMVLTVSGTEQTQRWKSTPGVGKAMLWLMPYETLQRRSQLKPEEIAGQLGEFMRFYALPNAPLSKGRLLHLKGQLAGQDGATGFYQSARPSFEELGFLSELPSNNDLDKMKQDLSKIKTDLVKANNDPAAMPSPFLQSQKQELDERIADVDLAKMANKLQSEYTNLFMKLPKFKSEEESKIAKIAFQRQAMQLMLTNILFGKQDATFWLALLAYDRGNYNSAEDYLSKRILEKMPPSPWRHAALYNLAQTVEAAGQIDRAVMIYQADPDAPDAYGRQLRARWLEEKNNK
jgi:hypothetical protein